MSKTLKTVLAVVAVLILMVGAFFLGQYVSKELVKDANDVSEKNDIKEDTVVAKEEYYKIYRENGKVYIELNNNKEFLMNINDDIELIYDNDKLYYIEENTKDQNYVVNYIDIKSKKKYSNVAEIYNKNNNIYFLDIEDDYIYYSCDNEDKFEKENIIKQMIFKYNIKTKKETVVIEKDIVPSTKGLGGLISYPSAIADGDNLYLIMDDRINTSRSLYKITNEEQVLLDKGIDRGVNYNGITNTMKIVDNKLYYVDSSIYSYDLKTGQIIKELETDNIIGDSVINSERIIVVTGDNEIIIKDKERIKKIKLKLHKDLYSKIYDYSDETVVQPFNTNLNVKNNLVISYVPPELGSFEININDLTEGEYTITKDQQDDTSGANELIEVMR